LLNQNSEADSQEVVIAAAESRETIEIRNAAPEAVEIVVEDSSGGPVDTSSVQSSPETSVAAPEPEIEEIAAPAAAEEIAAQVVEQAETPFARETAPQEPIGETVIAALPPDSEPEPAREPERKPESADIPERPAELPTEEEARESALSSDAELEWARIDAALDVSEEDESLGLGALPAEDAGGMHFDLAGVIIDGSSIYSASELLPSYRRYLGQEV
jgi:hypothetical protein